MKPQSTSCKNCLMAWCLSLVFLTMAVSSTAQEAPYYKGKTVRIIAGFPSGEGVAKEKGDKSNS